jgi:hypothetical protein
MRIIDLILENCFERLMLRNLLPKHICTALLLNEAVSFPNTLFN